MEVTKVSKESLQKAMEVLGLSKAEEATPVVAETTVDVVSDEIKKAEEEVILAQAKLEELKNPKSTESKIEKADNAELIKGFENKIGAIATLVQSKDDKIEELQKAIGEITEFNKALANKIGMIEKTPMTQKSAVTAKAVERFENGAAVIEKGIRTISIGNKTQRAELAEEIFNAATKDGKVNEELAKACTEIELGQVPPAFQKRLLTDFKIRVVR